MDKTQISQRERAANRTKHWARLTRACNNHCIFCLDKEAQNGSFISLEEIKEDLVRGRKNSASKVILSGGEPTIHPQFFEIVKLAKDIGYPEVQVISNGRMFMYKDFLNAAVKSGMSEVTFSMHGHNARLHDYQTQVLGSFSQALCGLRNALSRDGLIVNIDIVINKANVRHLDKIIKFFIQMGVTEFDLLQVIPFGRAWDNKESVFYNMDQSLAYLRRAFGLSRNPNLYIWTNRLPARYLQGYEDLIQHPVKLYDEINGRKDIFERFLNNGKAIGCAGERCRYCFLEYFCEDLFILAKERTLVPKKMPCCLRRKNTISGDKSRDNFVLRGEKNILLEFLGFYIKSRYFLKSLKCGKCKLNNACDGAPINYIRNNGFKSLKAQ